MARKLRPFTIGLIGFLALSQVLYAQTDGPKQISAESKKIQLFTTPDDSSPPASSVEPDEILSSIAEALGAGDRKWYLVKTKFGSVGWIRASDAAKAEELKNIFKPLPVLPFSIPLDLPSASESMTPRNAIVVSVHMTGSMVIVPVTLNRKVQTSMVLDTGATSSLVTRQVAALLRLKSASRTTIMTVAGAISVPLAILGSLKVGEAEAKNLTVVIQDIGSDPRVGGLLGLDFLSRYHTSLDSRRQLLTLAPR